MVLFSLIIGVVAVVTASVPGDLSQDARPWEPIRVISSSHEIDFPDEVVLRLEAESEVEIAEVTMFYRLGVQSVRTYGYPEFTPATHVSAEFRIKTGGANYIPSGVDIEYHYVFRDVEDNTFESERFFLEYKDPQYQWQTVRRGEMVVLFHNRSIDTVAEVATVVDQSLRPVKELLGLEEIRPMKAVILSSSREAGRSFPFVSDAARRGHLYGGFAFGELDLFVLVGLDPNGMVHEMTHLLVDEALSSPLARLPAWLNEGLAMYFESGPRGRDATVSQAARSDSLLPLRSMAAVPGRPQDVRLFYAQSWSLVNHMMETHGRERMAALFRAVNDGKGIDRAVSEAYGMRLDQLESEWRAGLSGERPDSPLPNPGVVGTSLIIGGAVAVGVVAVVIRWLRHIFGASNAGGTAP